MRHEKIDINLLDQNNGQVEGLPLNPRTWTKDELRTLKESLKQTPELFDARGIIVYPYKDRYVVLGGNMRLAASKQLKLKQVPCIVVPENTPLAKLKEIVIKDNGAFGAWDVSALQNDWSDLPLSDWGVNVPEWKDNVSPDDYGESFSLPEGDKSPFKQLSFVLANEQYNEIENALSQVKQETDFSATETFGNSNSNGNAIFEIVKQWVDARK